MSASFSPQLALVLINPRSGACRRRPELIAQLHQAAGDRAVVRTTEDIDALEQACRDAARNGVTRVGCVGGDGSASAITTALYRAYEGRPLPELALLRGGTMNTIATCLGAPHKPAVTLLERWLRAPRPAGRCATLRVQDELGFLFGAGLFPNWLSAYYEAGRGQPTQRTAFELTLHTAVSALFGGSLSKRVASPVAARIEADGETWPDDPYIAFMAGAVEEVGLGFRVFPQARADERKVDFIGLRSPGWRLAASLPNVYLRRRLSRSTHVERLVGEARLTPLNGSPLKYSLDGDLRESHGPLCVQRGPAFPLARW